MAHSPFGKPAVPTPPQPASTAIPPRPAAAPAPTMAPVTPARAPEAAERRTLVVGRGISLQGTVTDAERLVVEGTIEASTIQATELAIKQGGVFKGAVTVEDAEIAGTIDGDLTVRGALIVRSTGRVMGKARYKRLQVEEGGQITGSMEILTEANAGPSPFARPSEHAPIPATAN